MTAAYLSSTRASSSPDPPQYHLPRHSLHSTVFNMLTTTITIKDTTPPEDEKNATDDVDGVILVKKPNIDDSASNSSHGSSTGSDAVPGGCVSCTGHLVPVDPTDPSPTGKDGDKDTSGSEDEKKNKIRILRTKS